MNRQTRCSASKKPTNVSLPSDLVEEAKRLGINLSQACEAALSVEVHKALGEKWKRDNREAIESWNEWIAENGMPYDEYRQF
jgi:antitoxin CcdA